MIPSSKVDYFVYKDYEKVKPENFAKGEDKEFTVGETIVCHYEDGLEIWTIEYFNIDDNGDVLCFISNSRDKKIEEKNFLTRLLDKYFH